MIRHQGIPWVVVGVLVSLLVLPVGAASDPLQERIRDLVVKVVSGPALKGKRVGVGDFLSYEGRSNQLGVHVSEQLVVEFARLADMSGFQVVERRLLAQVMQEHQLWVSDRFTPSQAQQLGTLAGIDLLALGSLGDLGDRISLTVKLIETSTGVNLSSDSFAVRKDGAIMKLLAEPAPIPPRPSPEATTTSPGNGGGLGVKLWADRPSYWLGDTIRFHFTTDRDAYVTLVDVGTSGAVSIIFPNRFSHGNFVRGGQQVTIPGEGEGFEFILHGLPGSEIVRLVATDEPVEFLPTDFSAVPGNVRSLTRREASTLTRDIAAVKARIPPSRWAEAVVTFEIR